MIPPSTTPNPQAFPVSGDTQYAMSQPGMTLLDWFAGKAIEGMLSRDIDRTLLEAASPREVQRAYASLSYDQAEEMLKESERRKKANP